MIGRLSSVMTGVPLRRSLHLQQCCPKGHSMSIHGTRSSGCMLPAVPKRAKALLLLLQVLSLLHVWRLCKVSSQTAKE